MITFDKITTERGTRLTRCAIEKFGNCLKKGYSIRLLPELAVIYSQTSFEMDLIHFQPGFVIQ